MLRGIRGIQGSFRGFRNIVKDDKVVYRYFSSYDPLDRPTFGNNVHHNAQNIDKRGPRGRWNAAKRITPFNFSDIKFSELFDANKVSNIHDVKEGGYVDISKEDLAKYVPEGVAGEMDEEFALARRCLIMSLLLLMCLICPLYRLFLLFCILFSVPSVSIPVLLLSNLFLILSRYCICVHVRLLFYSLSLSSLCLHFNPMSFCCFHCHRCRLQ